MSSRTANPEQDSRPDSRGAAATAGTRLVVIWLAVLGVVVGLGWLITHQLQGSVNPWDNDVSRWFAGHRTSTLDPVADFGTLLGETPIGVAVAAVAGGAWALWRRTWRPILFVAVLEAGIGALYFVTTHVVTRQRPPVKILDPGLVPDHSFPSGHVATAVVAYGGVFVLAAVYAGSRRRLVAPVLLLPVLVLLSRLYQGAHHLTDVVTSVGYASVWLLVVARQVLLPSAQRAAPGRDREVSTAR